MRIRSVLLGVIPVLCGLFVGAVLLSSCDSGAGFSSLEDMPLNDGLTGKARAWYSEQVQVGVSEHLSKVTSSDDSLALLAFIEKFPPDWDKAVVLSLDGTEETLVLTTTLGAYTDERYDTTTYHVRTLVMNMEPSGDIVSGYVIAFSSEQKLSKDDFADYVERYVAKDFTGMEITVSRYTIMFEDVDSYFYRPDHIPLQLSMYLSKEDVLGKNIITGMNEISNPVSDPSDLCYLYCKRSKFGEICAQEPGPVGGPYGSVNCGARFRTFCSDYCFPSGGGGGGGNNGGGGGSNSNEDENEDECSCSNPLTCDLADEYTPNDQGSWSCSDFDIIPSEWRRGKLGYESKHNGLGYISPTLRGSIHEMRYQFDMAFYITSAYRCPNGNAKVSTATLSQHKYGTAADLYPPNSQKSRWTETFKHQIAVNAVRQRGAGYSDYQYESKEHVHVDWGPKRGSPWQ